MNLDSIYQDVILDHYRHPHGRGLKDPYDIEVHHVNPTCGDEVTLRLTLHKDTLSALSHDAMGCSISQASLSMMVELLTGLSTREALELEEEFHAMVTSRPVLSPADTASREDRLGDAVALQGVSRYPARVKCALLPWMALKDALLRSDPPTEAALAA